MSTYCVYLPCCEGLATSASAGGSLINSMKKRPSKGTTPPPDEQDAVLEEEIMTKIKSEKERISLTAADLLSIDYVMTGPSWTTVLGV